MKNRIYIVLTALLICGAAHAVTEGLQSVTSTDANGNHVTATLVSGTTYTLTPSPAEGYEFSRWMDGNTDNPRTVTPTDDIEYKALFLYKSAVFSTQGSVDVSIVSAADETFQLTITTGECGTFSKWSNNATTKTIDYSAADGLVYPQYSDLDLIREETPTAQGYIRVEEQLCGFRLTAMPESGSRFVCWMDNNSTNPVREIGYTDDQEYQAKFASTFDLTLNDNEDNSSKLADADGYTAENVYTNRTLVSASYNTIVLPFSLTSAQVATAFGKCTIQEFTGTSFENDNQTLVLEFVETDHIEAGVPYLIQPASDVANAQFAEVMISKDMVNATDTYADFKGIYSPAYICEQGVENKNVLFVGAANSLYWPSATSGQMKGMRGYFELKDSAPSLSQARFSFVRQNLTDMAEVDAEQKGAYKQIVDGKLVIVRDGVQYSAEGQKIK